MLTREAVRRRFQDRGVTVTAWANSNRFTREQVYAFLAALTEGTREVSHRPAIASDAKVAPAGDTEEGLEQPKPMSSGRRQEPKG